MIIILTDQLKLELDKTDRFAVEHVHASFCKGFPIAAIVLGIDFFHIHISFWYINTGEQSRHTANTHLTNNLLPLLIQSVSTLSISCH